MSHPLAPLQRLARPAFRPSALDVVSARLAASGGPAGACRIGTTDATWAGSSADSCARASVGLIVARVSGRTRTLEAVVVGASDALPVLAEVAAEAGVALVLEVADDVDAPSVSGLLARGGRVVAGCAPSALAGRADEGAVGTPAPADVPDTVAVPQPIS